MYSEVNISPGDEVKDGMVLTLPFHGRLGLAHANNCSRSLDAW